jgi:hypothetical protein
MRSNKARRLRPLLAVMVLAMVVVPVSIAGATGAEQSKAPPKNMAKQVKALKKKTATMASQLAALQERLSALEGGGQEPTSLLGGPAGGDLAGTFPNPQLRAGSVLSGDIADGTIAGTDVGQGAITSSSILDNTIGSTDVTNNSLAQLDLGMASVGAPQLLNTFPVRSGPNPVGGTNASGGNSATCPPGSRLLGGGGEFTQDPPRGSLEIFKSVPSPFDPNTTWEVAGHNDTGSTRDIVAVALCLAKGF